MTAKLDRTTNHRLGPGRPCTVCEHPDREAIDNDLLCGRRYRTIANRYGIASHVNVIRHAQNHLQGPPIPVSKVDPTDPERIKATLLALETRLHEWLDAFEAAKDPKLSLAAAREIRKVLELSARLGGQLNLTIEHLDDQTAALVGQAIARAMSDTFALLRSGEAVDEVEKRQAALISNALEVTATEVA